MKTFKIAMLVMIVGLASGCATTEHVNRVEASAAQAQQAASDAAAKADRALQSAQEAAAKADRALQAAEDAKTCCQQNSEKINRIFEKSMQK